MTKQYEIEKGIQEKSKRHAINILYSLISLRHDEDVQGQF